MPLISEAEATAGLSLLPGRMPDQDATPAPDFLSETVPAAFRLDNTVGATLAAEPRGTEGLDTEYDPFQDIAGYEPFASAFVRASGPDDGARIKRNIDQELDDRRTLAGASGFASFAAQFAAGALDPVNLIPVGGTAARAGRGANILHGALETARAGLLSTAAQEAILQGTEATRMPAESAANIAAGTFVSGLLGGAVGAFRAPWGEFTSRLDRDLTTPPAGAADPLAPGAVSLSADDLARDTHPAAPDSLGAASARAPVADEKLTSALGLEVTPLRKISPMMRTATSPSIATRQVAQELIETPFSYQKNALGIGSPIAVETKIKTWQAPLTQALEDIDGIFLRYRQNRAGNPRPGAMTGLAIGDAFGAARRSGKLTRQDFLEEVGRAMRRGDQGSLPEVTEAAQRLRRLVFDPLKQRAIELGLLPEDVTTETADSYLTRVWNIGKVKARRPELINRTVDWLKGQRDGAEQRMNDADAQVAELQPKIDALERELRIATPASRGADTALAEARRRRLAAERDAMGAGRQQREAETLQRQAAQRAASVAPVPGAASDAELKAFVRDLRRGSTKDQPESLASFLIRRGGLRDEDGTLADAGVSSTARPGLIAGKGSSIEEALRVATEAGYLDPGATGDDLLAALADDLSGEAPVYSARDIDQVLRSEYVAEFRAELDRAGVDLGKMSAAQLAELLAPPVNAEGRTLRDTSASRARSREAEFTSRRAEKAAERARARAEAAAAKLEAARADVDRLHVEASRLSADAANKAGTLRKLRTDLERAAARAENERAFGRSDDAELEDIAQQIIDRILGAPDGRIPYEIVPLKRGALKERTFGIPDHLVEDFLESDAEMISRFYVRTMAPDVELAARFGRPDMEGALASVHDDYVARTRTTTDEKELKRLADQRAADVRDLAAMRDRLRGTYAAPADPDAFFARATNALGHWNFIRLMGRMTFGSIPDLARPVMREGILRVVGNGLAPMVRDFRSFRLAAKEAKLAGTALDMTLDTRALSLWDIGDTYGRHSAFERGLAAAARQYGPVTLMSPWNAALKQFVGVVTQARVLEDATKLAAGKLDRAGRTKLAQVGISGELAERIATQFREHGQTVRGARIANTEAWTDGAALEAFRAALVREVDATITTPGVGYTPLWMSSQAGRLIGQFKTFTFAATQSVAIAGLQQRDAAALNGLLLSVGLGMLVYAVDGWSKGRELSDNPGQWILEGIDRSGVTGVLFEANSILEKTTRGTLGLNALVGGEPLSRYASRATLDALAGPTAGLIEDTAKAAGAISTGEVAASDVAAMRRILPFQNLFWISGLLDQAQVSITEALGTQSQ